MSTEVDIFHALQTLLSSKEKQGAQEVARRIMRAKPQHKALGEVKLMVAYGGGKDSTYTVAFMRTVQLYLKQQYGETFILRVANMRHAGVPFAVMENINRVYQRLGLLNNPEAELLTIDNDQIREFDLHLPMPQEMVDINRTDILMNGHRSLADGRPTFCNSCNLSVANFYGLACWHQGGIDFLVTGDSKKEQKHYYTWIMRMAQKIGLDVSDYRAEGFQGVLGVLNEVGEKYYQSLYGENNTEELQKRTVSAGNSHSAPMFLSIYDVVDYRVDEHWALVVEFLGFEFDELAFSFTESDCFNPALMAHIRGLKVQYEQGRSYLEGLEEYLGLAGRLMNKKEIPQTLIDMAMARYATPEKCMEMNDKVSTYASEVFGMTEDHLITMVMSPFTDNGARLQRYLEVLPADKSMPETDIHSLLSGTVSSAEKPRLTKQLEQQSGLPLAMLKTLYTSETLDFSKDDNLIAYIRKNDPHKFVIKTFDPVSGQAISELVSGR